MMKRAGAWRGVAWLSSSCFVAVINSQSPSLNELANFTQNQTRIHHGWARGGPRSTQTSLDTPK